MVGNNQLYVAMNHHWLEIDAYVLNLHGKWICVAISVRQSTSTRPDQNNSNIWFDNPKTRLQSLDTIGGTFMSKVISHTYT